MSQSIVSFVRRHWLTVLLVGFIVYLLAGPNLLAQRSYNFGSPEPNFSMAETKSAMIAGGDVESMPPIYDDVAPTTSSDRMTVLTSSLSLLVDSVSETISSVQYLAESAGGYLVNSNLHEPEGGATGNISVRVPVAKRSEVISEIRSLGIRVVDEHTTGYDVTDQYTDIEAHLATLRTTKSKFEAMLDQATSVQDSLSVQRELTNLQRQIDSYVGQQKYLEGNASLSLISVSLATDELALPYAPDEPWRPAVVFRTAVRSLLSLSRSLISLLIWVGVYSPLILLFGGGYWWYKRRTNHGN